MFLLTNFVAHRVLLCFLNYRTTLQCIKSKTTTYLRVCERDSLSGPQVALHCKRSWVYLSTEDIIITYFGKTYKCFLSIYTALQKLKEVLVCMCTKTFQSHVS